MRRLVAKPGVDRHPEHPALALGHDVAGQASVRSVPPVVSEADRTAPVRSVNTMLAARREGEVPRPVEPGCHGRDGEHA